MEILVTKLANDLRVAKIVTDFHGQKQVWTRLRETARNRTAGILQLQLRIHGHIEAAARLVQETPFHSQQRIVHATFHAVAFRHATKEPAGFILELDVLAQAVVEVDVRNAEQPLLPVTLLQVSDVDLPLSTARRTRVVREHWRATLRKG